LLWTQPKVNNALLVAPFLTYHKQLIANVVKARHDIAQWQCRVLGEILLKEIKNGWLSDFILNAHTTYPKFREV